AGIDCRLKIDEAITTDPLDSRTRHGIFLAFKEALNNIVRHSEADEVHLNIEVARGNLVILLADNGRGIGEVSALPGSDGLRNMEDRIRALGGRCIIGPRAGGGTTVRFEIPLIEKKP
ncbi:MAG: histidine kinase, partial [Verrucomicrobiaceae bacterium]